MGQLRHVECAVLDAGEADKHIGLADGIKFDIQFSWRVLVVDLSEAARVAAYEILEAVVMPQTFGVANGS